MSRIGTQPITIPSGVTIEVSDTNAVTVRGPKGELRVQLAANLVIAQEDGTLAVSRPDNDRHSRSQHQTVRRQSS